MEKIMVKLQSRRKTGDAGGNPVHAMFLSVFVMFLVSGLLLLFLALLLYQMDLSEGAVKIGIVAIYVISGVTGGIMMGKVMKEQKFLWGLAAGVLYFMLLMLVSLLVKGGLEMELAKLVTTGILCAASGMAGGMVS